MFKSCAFLLVFAVFSVTAFPQFRGGSSDSDVIELRLRRQANPAKGKPNQNQPPPPPPQNQGGGQNGGNRPPSPPPPPPSPQGNGNPPRPSQNPGSNCQNGNNPPPPPPPRGNGRPGRRPPPPPPPRGGHGHGGCNNYPETTSQRPEEVTSDLPIEITTKVPEVSPTYEPIAVGSSTDRNVGTSDPIDYSLNTTLSPLESQTVSGTDFPVSNPVSNQSSLSTDLPESHTTSVPLLADSSTSSSDSVNNEFTTSNAIFELGSTISVSILPEAGSTQSTNIGTTTDSIVTNATPVTDLPYSTSEPIVENSSPTTNDPENVATSTTNIPTEQVTASNPTISLETRSPCSPYPEATTVFGVTLP